MKLKPIFKKIFNLPFHPLLFAVFPIFSVYSTNILELLPEALIQPLTYVVPGVLIIFLTSSLVFRDFRKGAVLTSIFSIWFFSHGHLHELAEGLFGRRWWDIFGIELGIDDSLFLAWGSVLAGTVILLFRARTDLRKVTNFLNLTSLVAVSLVLTPIAWYELDLDGTFIRQNEAQIFQSAQQINNKPDIYYIILDRYAAESTLSDFYGYDNGPFLNFLRSKGFYIADESIANYPRTWASLPSSLNMRYLSPDDKYSSLVKEGHELGQFLKEQGYIFLNVGSWYWVIHTNDLANENLLPSDFYLSMDEFSINLLKTTAIMPVLGKLFPNIQSNSKAWSKAWDDQWGNLHRDRTLYQASILKEIPKIYSSPKFVFTHILLPHEPYVLDSNCSQLDEPAQGNLPDYLAQLSCANRLMTSAINAIIINSPQPPIVVIQADEGPVNFKYPWVEGQSYQDADQGSYLERARILNSYYLPGVDSASVLYPSISPVNSFRLILNLYFGTNLDLLPDRSYIWHETGNLYDDKRPDFFIDVTDILHR